MRRIVLISLIGAGFTLTPVASAQAALTLVGTFEGNQCGGAGGFAACWASGTTAGTGAVLKTPGGSPSIRRIDSDGPGDFGSFGTIDGSEFTTSYVAGTNTLSFTYTPGAGDPTIHYIGLFQGGSGPGNDFKNTYRLFYDSSPITAGSFALSTYFDNPGWSHIDFFDTGSPSVPESATWAMMLLGFGLVGMVMRRNRKLPRNLMQLA
ncbi:PEPxxWA-CTERM sorting domain-containing protein [Sphingomonas limnosediminicola]